MISMPPPPKPRSTLPRTLLSENRAEVAAALLSHIGDDGDVTELLDFAQLHGDAQTAAAAVSVDGDSWLLELFGPRREAA